MSAPVLIMSNAVGPISSMEQPQPQPQPQTLPTREDFIALLQALTQPATAQAPTFQQQQAPQRRRVTFDNSVTVVQTTHSSLPREELRELWYSAGELRSFKMAAKNMALQNRRRTSELIACDSIESIARIMRESISDEDSSHNDANATTSTPQKLVGVAGPDFDSMRGLECSTLPRQRQKIMAIKCTMSACRRGLKAEEVAFVSRNCSSWATHVAYVTACHDFCHAWEDQHHLLSTLPAIPTIPPAFPYATKQGTKRSSPTTSQQRRVRCRT